MILNGDIFIPTVTGFQLQDAFALVLAALTTGLPRQFPELIHSIYLYGSVARGEATPGVSDLDITLLLARPAAAVELQHIEQWRQNFQQQHAIVSKVDFDIGTVDQALKPSNLFSWGYWLKHHCRCIWGSDLSSAFPLFQPDRRIPQAVNADLRAVLEQYFQNIADERVPAELQRLKREAARKLIRATNMLRDPDSRFWPIALNDYAEQFLAVYPDRAAELEYLLAHAAGTANDAAFADNARGFLDWLERQ
ncbi:nucleotidyltransferase domain-containing protein [Serratia inhibens]|uniref:Nucleotidyltransferase domain-containing protein n=1 Tax=Serratia inhibens TaxID=2338073 RepID=A0AA93BVP3_9GAMM|nr:nucleotidyltransferase domain-containing protein [Serratia inhibens]RJF55038.1 nucleotidyltransferase domain-containing protein [Serratia inhibens]